jgi:hypothetical protein
MTHAPAADRITPITYGQVGITEKKAISRNTVTTLFKLSIDCIAPPLPVYIA